MSKIIEDLKAAGWVDTTLGECRPGEEVVIEYEGHVWNVCITSVDVTQGTITNTMGFQWATETPALRPPQPEYAPGTVALITWDEADESVRDLLPVRAMMDAGGVWRGAEVFPPRSLDRIEVVRVLLPAEQDTPPITNEMVDRGAEAHLANSEDPTTGSQWDEFSKKYLEAAARYRQEARAAIKAALGVEE